MYVDQSHFMNSVKIVPHTLDQESPVNTDVSISILITCGKHARRYCAIVFYLLYFIYL